MKKILTIICTILAVVALTLSVFAADATVTVSSTNAKLGDEITLNVSVSPSVANVGAGGVIASYDSNALEFVSGSWSVSNTFLANFDNSGTGVFMCDTGATTTLSGTVCTLTFKVKDNAPVGPTTVSVNASINVDNSNISVSVTSGTVTIADHTYGDWVKVDDTNHKRVCSGCQKEETKPHNWDNGVETTPATCKDKGVKTYTCTACNATKTEDIAKLTTHTYGEWTKADATNHKRTCSVCQTEETKSHTWDGGKITQDPTCKDTGVKTFTCTACGETKTEDVPKTTTHNYGDWVKADDTNHKRVCTVCQTPETKAHTWNSGVETTPATCKDTGVKTFTCTACNATKTEDIPKTTTHTYGSWTEVDATNHKRTCTVCQTPETKAHTWNSGVVTTPATCKDTGVKTFTCTACNATKTEDVPKTNNHSWQNYVTNGTDTHNATCSVCDRTQELMHSWNGGRVVTSATCKNDGIKEYTCTNCRETRTETIDKLTTHTWDNGVETTPATCKDKGVKTFTCSVCGEAKAEDIAKLTAHTWGDWAKVDENGHKHTCSVCQKEETVKHTYNSGEVTKAATEEETGIRLYTCTVCSATKEEVIPKADHRHEYGTEWLSDESNHWNVCHCGDKANLTAHTYGEGTVVAEATCTADGTMQYTCTVCGYINEEAIPAGHTEGEFETESEATCQAQGKEVKKCTACGEVLEERYTDKAQHTVGEWETVKPATEAEDGEQVKSCTVCGEVLETEVLPKLEPEQAEVPVVVIIIASVVAAAAVIGVVIFFIKKK